MRMFNEYMMMVTGYKWSIKDWHGCKHLLLAKQLLEIFVLVTQHIADFPLFFKLIHTVF